ncbi:hypothetical protein OPIT5_00185 (plasmid) [Opitutaceae bacterium TAV5]|nr:hypothetical protein OPIT5_00160 [Opitutaceae bacterium TAV5]AHF94986.1 hypothetical protein OPIT5_00185 [Opitutaceae bacterium TAV5]
MSSLIEYIREFRKLGISPSSTTSELFDRLLASLLDAEGPPNQPLPDISSGLQTVVVRSATGRPLFLAHSWFTLHWTCLLLDIPPVVMGRPTALPSPTGKGPPRLVTDYQSQKFQNRIGLACKALDLPPPQPPSRVCSHIDPQRTFLAWAPHNGIPPWVRGDIDNFAKNVMDGLQKARVVQNDRTIAAINFQREDIPPPVLSLDQFLLEKILEAKTQFPKLNQRKLAKIAGVSVRTTSRLLRLHRATPAPGPESDPLLDPVPPAPAGETPPPNPPAPAAPAKRTKPGAGEKAATPPDTPPRQRHAPSAPSARPSGRSRKNTPPRSHAIEPPPESPPAGIEPGPPPAAAGSGRSGGRNRRASPPARMTVPPSRASSPAAPPAPDLPAPPAAAIEAGSPASPPAGTATPTARAGSAAPPSSPTKKPRAPGRFKGHNKKLAKDKAARLARQADAGTPPAASPPPATAKAKAKRKNFAAFAAFNKRRPDPALAALRNKLIQYHRKKSGSP